MRPGRGVMTTTRSARNTASGIEWVTNRMVLRARGEVALAPDAQQLERHLVARHRVERAERLVHQQERRIEQQRAAERGALLHAARQLARQLLGEPVQARHLEQLAGRAPGRRAGPSPASSAGSSTLSRIVRHFSSTGAWKTMPTSAIGRVTVRPATVTAPTVAGRSPATMRSRVDLPQPLGPTSATNSPRADREVDAGERLDRAARRLRRSSRPGRGRSAAVAHDQRAHFGISTLVRNSLV